jgi:hypothetical protein
MLNTFYLVIASEGRSQRRTNPGRKDVASVKTMNQRLLAKTKKMTKPKNKPTPKPRMV